MKEALERRPEVIQSVKYTSEKKTYIITSEYSVSEETLWKYNSSKQLTKKSFFLGVTLILWTILTWHQMMNVYFYHAV